MASTTQPDIEEIIADRFGIDRSAFDDGTRFEEDLGVESLDLVEMAEAIDATWGVYIPDDDLAELETVGAVKDYVTERAD